MTTAMPIGSWSQLQPTSSTKRSTAEGDAPQYGAGNEPLASWLGGLERPTLAPVGEDVGDDRFDSAVAKMLQQYGPMLKRLAE